MLVGFVVSVFVHYPSFFWCLGRDVIRDGHLLGIFTYIFVFPMRDVYPKLTSYILQSKCYEILGN